MIRVYRGKMRVGDSIGSGEIGGRRQEAGQKRRGKKRRRKEKKGKGPWEYVDMQLHQPPSLATEECRV